MNKTQIKILIAVAELTINSRGTSSREIARHLDRPLPTINNYFYGTRLSKDQRFKNGDILKWTPGQQNTIRPVKPLVILEKGGEQVAVGRVEARIKDHALKV